MASKRVAVVTGSNKGIGLAIVERLARELPDWAVYLTARNPELGQASVKSLADKGVKTNFHQLDITCDQSIERFAQYLKEKYGGLDILVNNAAIAVRQDQETVPPLGEQAEFTLRTNFFGTLKVCDHLFPLLRPHARVVNVSGSFAFVCLSKVSPEQRMFFTSPTITMDQLVASMHLFVDDAIAGIQPEFYHVCLATSKLAVTVMSMIQQRDFDRDSREDLIVNACCPGFVPTDLSGHKGDSTLEEGADTPCYLATLATNSTSPKGKHLRDRLVQEWK